MSGRPEDSEGVASTGSGPGAAPAGDAQGAQAPGPDLTQTADDEGEPSRAPVTSTATADQDREPRWLESRAEPRRYTKGDLIGRGGVGAVYDAFDHELSRAVVIKELQTERRSHVAEVRFERESQITAQLQHPGIVPVYGRGRNADGGVFYAMKKVEGRNFRQAIEEAHGYAARLELIETVERVAETVAFAHERGIVHRDLKPSNIMVGEYGETVVIDWGIAKRVGDDPDHPDHPDEPTTGQDDAPQLTRANQVLGTPAYMSPQQALGASVGKEADVYSLGAILYHVLAGKLPFQGSSAEVLASARDGKDPTPLLEREPRVPRDLAAIVAKAMARRPQDRLRDAGELASELKRFRNGNLVRAYRYSPLELARLWVKRNRLVLGAVVVALVFGVGVTAWQSAAATRGLVDRDLARAREALDAGESAFATALARRDDALELFRSDERTKAEPLWDEWAAASDLANRRLTESARAVEAAIARVEPSKDTLEFATRLAVERVELARLRNQDELEAELLARLTALAGPERATALLDARSSLAVAWSDARFEQVELLRYDTSREPWPLESVTTLAKPGAVAVPAGSYVAVAKNARGEELLRVPIWLDRGADIAATLAVPEAVPDNTVAIPAGPYWAGVDAPDPIRRTFSVRPPVHQRSGRAFLIGRTETTFGDWISFLESLDPSERGAYMPAADDASRGLLIALEQRSGEWRLQFRAVSNSPLRRLGPGEPLEYPDRERDRIHPWMTIPVAGVSASQARRYLEFLRTSGRVPRARLCTEDEWMRAGRGADRRRYPTGDQLDPLATNVDASYGRDRNSFGPNAVALHPENASPYGVLDLAGNVAELVTFGERIRLAGGIWYGNAMFAMVTSWQPFAEDQKAADVGFRVCADYEGPISTIESRSSQE